MTLNRTTQPLSLGTIRALRRVFAERDHKPDQRGWLAIESLVRTFEQMAQGTLDPNFYLCSLPPGFGKTTAVTTFVSELLASSLYQHVGILLCVPRLDMIGEFVTAIGAQKGGLHVLTSDEKCNALSTADADKARVLVTTHSMVISRCRDGSFADAAEFYYQGKPRAWRCLDESIVPGLALSLSTSDLAFLITVTKGHPKLSRAILDLIVSAEKAGDGSTLCVPNFLEEFGVTPNDVLGMLEGWQTGGRSTPVSPAQDDQKAIITHLWMLAGKVVTVRFDGALGASVLDYKEQVPPDLAPIVLLDASGGVRGTYEAWSEGRGNLVRLPNAEKNYQRLKVRVWNRGGGKGSWSDKRKSIELVDGIASEANRILDEEPQAKLLFVVHRPAGANDYERDIRSLLKSDDNNRIRFTTWGRHDSTNEFADFSYVFLCGTLFYRPSFYEALGRAAAGKPSVDGKLDDELQRRVIEGEHKHLILQAACRGAVRKSDGGACHPMTLYVIASARSGIANGLKDVFPGCRVSEWKAKPVALKGRCKQAAEFVETWLDQQAELETAFLRYREVAAGIGMKAQKDFKRYVRHNEEFAAFMHSKGLVDDFSTPKAAWTDGWRYTDFAKHFEDETIPSPIARAQAEARGDF
jgi:hypothetical protein